MSVPVANAANPDGNLRIELISGYNFVVDSNVETPSTYAPRSAYLGATYHNDGDVALTNVYAYIGDYTNNTPGIYPARVHTENDKIIGPLDGGAFALTHEGGSLGTSDATRYLGTIEPGESKTVYWLVSYPNLDVDGKSVTGGVKPVDDLWLYFDVWGKAYEDGALLEADVRRQVFMRRMLSAMANKISPNGANKVPQEYKDLLDLYEPSWTNSLVDGSPGSGITTEGVWYDLGNINQGFDNDGDLIPDYNAWLQPVGDPAIFDAGCFRLVKTFAMVVIKRSAGDVVILAEDQLYFSNLPPDNNGAVGYVRYEFMPLCSGASATLSPYQAVASGKENEKFNGDFGATLGGGLTSSESSAEIDKQVDLAVAGANSNLNYTVAFTNNGEVVIGRPDAGLPIVIADSIPDGTTYVSGSAAAGNTLPAGVTAYTIFYSTNNTASWSQTEPATAADVTDIQWWLSDPLEPGAHGIVTFSVTVNSENTPPLIYNVAGMQLGDADPFLEDDATTLITGTRLISGTVFADIGTGGGTFGDGILNGTEAGISNVTVTLYYDINGNGILDDDDVLFATTVSATNGLYTFNNLPNGNYLVVVNHLDSDLPSGYTLTTTGAYAVEIVDDDETDLDFGFAPSLTLTKTGPATAEKGSNVVYNISVVNNLPPSSSGLVTTNWATARNTARDSGTAWTNQANALGPPTAFTNVATGTVPNATVYSHIALTGFSNPLSAGTVTNVKVRIDLDLPGVGNQGYLLQISITNSTGAEIIITNGVTGSSLGAGQTNKIYDITSAINPLNWAGISNATIRVGIRKDGGNGGQVLKLDAVGMIVQSDYSTTTITNIPLFDYYDTNVLQYVSATPSATTNDFGGPSPNTGRLFWSNVGPLAPGASTNISVTFKVIGPQGNAGTITTNQAAITNATFVTGALANTAFDDAATEIPATASIGDTTFWDANRSGSQDESEGGIEGVTVELYDSLGNFVTNTVTDTNGFYLFTGLVPGTYTVLVDTNSAPLAGASLSAHPDNDGVPIGDPLATVSNNFTTVTVIGGQDYRGADFGYVPPGATIGGVLWIDFNGNDVPDGGEGGIGFVTVTLRDGDGNVVATTETDADGNYLFYGLSDGTYSVVVHFGDDDFPSGLAQTFDPDGFSNHVATNIVVDGGTIVRIDGVDPWLAGDLNVNFGYRYEGNNSLSGTVGMDDPDNIDGLLNGSIPSGVGSNETAFAGVTVFVYLWNDNGNGVVNSGETVLLGTTVTDINGDYSFTNLPEGGSNDYYIVSLVAPYNFLSLTTTVDDTDATLLVKTENAQGHTLSAYQAIPIPGDNEPITNIDFAFISVVEYDFGDLPDSYRTTLASNGPRHIIADTNNPTLFLGSLVDTENNGLPSVGADGDDLDNLDDEDGVFVTGIWQNGPSNATVRVQVGAGGGWLVGFVDFDNSGEFDNANELVVSQAVSTNVNGGLYDFTFDVPAGSLSTTNSTFFYSRWRLLPSAPFLPAFAFQGEASNGEVEDYRWAFHAINGSVLVDDGITTNAFDIGDSPQAGVVVNLYTNGTLVATTVTDFNGTYRFYGLQDGAYRVSMETPTNATVILDYDGGTNTFTNIAVTVAGGSIFNRDFLLDTGASVASISGTVFNDSDASGDFGGDTPESGVTVRIYRDLDGDDIPDENEFVGSTVTGPDGTYLFENLPDGNYLIVIETPPNAVNVNDAEGAADDGLVAVTLSGTDEVNQDFLIKMPPRVSGTVRYDSAKDGTLDGDEPGVVGVVVQLLDTNSVVIATTITDANGYYQFDGVEPGVYNISIQTPGGFNNTADADGDGNGNNLIEITVADKDFIEQDFLLDSGVFYALGDRIWLDENSDGVQDAGEPGIANVTVLLYDSTGTILLATTVTDLEGNYLFTGLVEGDYIVRVATNTLGAGLVANPTYDLDGIDTAHETAVTLSDGQSRFDVDFGYNWSSTDDVLNGTGTGAIGDRVWIDADGDGIQDPGEPGLGGALVSIYYDPDGNGTYTNLFTAAVDQNGNTGTGTTTAEPDGSYVFYNLPPGAYVIVVNDGVTPAGYTQTGDPDDFGTVASDPDNSTTMPIILAPGDVFVNADFGYQPATSSAISGTVYFDANANTNLNVDAGEYGIAGVSVVLLDTNGVIIATTTTDENGNYTFSGLPAGDYTVWVNDAGNLLGGLYQTEDPDGTADNHTTVTVDGSTNSTGNDFGYTPQGHTSGDGLIGNTIFLDRDGNGEFDPGEPGLQGVTVDLYDAAGTTLLASTVTDANGNYWFGGLSTNDTTYVVRVDTNSLPNGGVGLTNTFDPDAPGLPPHTGDSESTVTLTGAAPINLDQDFGYNATTPNTIGGTIWEDRNADGILGAGETNGLAGITVLLTDTNGNVVATAVTDVDGNYEFTGLPDGTYVVRVTDTGNLLNGWWHSTGPAPGDDNNSQSDPYTVTVSGGATNTTADFGYYYAGAALGNRVWFDENYDGIQDAGEIGMTNSVMLRLTIVYESGITNVVTTLSDTNGFYSFGNLLLDENQNGTNAASPTFTISAINPGGGFNHTIFNKSGSPLANFSENPNGVEATAIQGMTDVSLTGAPADEIEQAWYDFGFTLTPTLAVITAVRSRVEDGVAIIAWDVSLELGTVGYYLERLVSGEWSRVHESLIESDPFAPPPFTYEQADPGALLGTAQRYRIVELDSLGQLLPYGPYDLDLDGGEVSYATWAAEIAWGDADSSPDADSDGDGLKNWQEYLAGTNPLNANSVLRVSRVEPRADGFLLTWQSAAGRRYAVEMTTSLVQPFIAIATGIEAEPPQNVLLIPVDVDAVGRAFFRVIVE